MKTIYINKNKKNELILYLNIVNTDDIKISWYSKNPAYFFEEHTMYFSLEKNILKLEYSDEIENVYLFTPDEKKKIKKECLKLFKKEYEKITNLPYKINKLETIKKYMEG